MSIAKIILFSLLGTSVLVVVVALMVSKHQKNRQNPNYKPVLSKKEKIVSGILVVIGVSLIVTGIIVPNFTTTKVEDSENYEQVDISDEKNLSSQSDIVVVD